MRNVQNIYIPMLIACIIYEISQMLKYLHAFLPVFKIVYFNARGRSTRPKHASPIDETKFIVVGGNTYVNIDKRSSFVYVCASVSFSYCSLTPEDRTDGLSGNFSNYQYTLRNTQKSETHTHTYT